MTTEVYELTGVRDFAFPHAVRYPNQLTLELSPGGVVPPSEYTVIGYGPSATGVTVRYPNAPVSEDIELRITRYTQPERVATFDDDRGVTARALNAEFDNVYQSVQDFSAQLEDRADALIETELPPAVDAYLDTELPPLVEGLAQPFVDDAEQARDSAQSSANSAANSANSAANSANIASSARNEAVNARDNAQTARNQAQGAAQTATDAASEAEDLVTQATSGFVGFEDGIGYDFGSITTAMTYFDRDWGLITDSV